MSGVAGRVISFDGDNTLWDWDGALESALRAVIADLERLGARTELSVSRLIAIRHQVGVDMGEETASLVGMRKESLRRTAIESGIIASAEIIETLFTTFMSSRDRALEPFDGVLETLSKLHAEGWTNILLTNGNGNPEHTGLLGLLDHLLYAEKIGVKKPELGAFQAVSDVTGCELSDLIHVGDSLFHDVVGAQKAGATGVWFNPLGLEGSTGFHPDHEIRNMIDVHQILATR